MFNNINDIITRDAIFERLFESMEINSEIPLSEKLADTGNIH